MRLTQLLSYFYILCKLYRNIVTNLLYTKMAESSSKSGAVTNKIISKDTVKRLLSDVKAIMKSPLVENGIYYIHDDTDLSLIHI